MSGGSNAVDRAMNADNNDTTEITSESSDQTDKDINTERVAGDIEVAKINADAEIAASKMSSKLSKYSPKLTSTSLILSSKPRWKSSKMMLSA